MVCEKVEVGVCVTCCSVDVIAKVEVMIIVESSTEILSLI